MRWRISPVLASRRQRRHGARISSEAVIEIGLGSKFGRGCGSGTYFKGTGGRLAWRKLGGSVESLMGAIVLER